ncbi:MAG: rhomboid family intramembrane serine protease [bacterium]
MIPIKDDNPRIRPPVVTVALIVVNVLVFLYELSLGPRLAIFIEEHGAIPAQIISGRHLETVITSMFLHGGFMHLAGNMLYLWIFGDNVEGYLGHLRFFCFYIACGVVAAMSHIVLGGTSVVVPMVGASGAISGVLGAYLVKYPRARVLVVIPIFLFIEILRIPALIVLGFWFVLQLFSGVMSHVGGQGAQMGGIAFWAHIGGFVAGIVLINMMKKKRPNRFGDYDLF